MKEVTFKNAIAVPIIGQEVVCPDGLGRIADIILQPANSYSIVVHTYIKNRACAWDSENVKLVQVLGVQQ